MIPMRTRGRSVLLVSTFLLVAIAACGNRQVAQQPNVPSNPSSTPQIGILDDVHEEIRPVSVVTVRQNNCDGTAEVENQEELSTSVEHTLQVGAEFELSTDGEIGIPGGIASVGLGAAIASRYGYSYGAVTSKSSSVTVKAGPGSNMEHRIGVSEVWKVGIAQIVVNSEVFEVPFGFRIGAKIEQMDSRDVNQCEPTAPPPTDPPTSIVPPTHDLPTPEVPTPEGPANIFIPDYICNPISLADCRCMWPPQPFTKSSISPMQDTWLLQNTGLGPLIIESEDTSCPECFAVRHNPSTGDSVAAGGSTPLTGTYYWDRDPLIDAQHNHTATIRSNAANCPVLEISIAVSYK